MNEIMVKGTQEFMGIAIPVIYGGFGEGKNALQQIPLRKYMVLNYLILTLILEG